MYIYYTENAGGAEEARRYQCKTSVGSKVFKYLISPLHSCSWFVDLITYMNYVPESVGLFE